MYIKALRLAFGAILFAIATVGVATQSDTVMPEDAIAWDCPPSCT